MTLSNHKPNRGFTLLELLVVFLVIGLMASTLLPALAREKQRVRRMQCADNLRGIGLAFKLWGFDQAGKPSLAEDSTPLSPDARRRSEPATCRFAVISNELSTPERLICPADSRLPSASFAALTATNLSYFAGLPGKDPAPRVFLAGDRNIKSGSPSTQGILVLTPAHAVGWGTDLHRRSGNILFTDGSVELFSSPELKRFIETCPATNHLAIP